MRAAIRQILFAGNPFSPLSLFAAGEQGAWYDPSDLTSMFQDAAGTTQVTAMEQPVGLLLDKSKGLTPGPEIVTNGDFIGGATGWATGSVSSSGAVVNGEWKTTFNGTSRSILYSNSALSTVAGKKYKVTLDVYSPNTTQAVFVSISGSLAVGFNGGALSPTKRTISGILDGGLGDKSLYITLTASLGAGIIVYVDNVSVKEIPGNHAAQTTLTARPVLKATPSRLVFDADPDILTATFQSAPGNCTVAYGVSGGDPVITYPVNISGTTYQLNPTNTGANNTGTVIISRQLTSAEVVKLTQWIRARS